MLRRRIRLGPGLTLLLTFVLLAALFVAAYLANPH